VIEIRGNFQKLGGKVIDKRQLLKIVALAIVRRIMTSFSSSSTPGKPPAVRTGNLRSNIGWMEVGKDSILIGVSSRAKYGYYLEHGTGLYGPRKRVIVPRSKKALKFTVGNRVVIVRSVKGVKPRPFIDPAVSYVFKEMKLRGKLSSRTV
jgi:hypothetical protein